MGNYERSRMLYERAKHVLAGGISSEFRRGSYPHPLFYNHAQGSRIYDVDDNEYLDFSLSQGPLLVGHNHSHVVDRVEKAARMGQLYAGQHLAELELAERIQQFVPCAELLRFSLSGSEASHAALRVARAVTGRNRFLRFEGHYHGWLDNVAYGVNGSDIAALGPREAPTPVPWTQGLPHGTRDEFLLLPWNDLALVEQMLAMRHQEIAAIITEPVMCNNGCIEPLPGFLAGLRELCDRYGIALIFDEVITGFRLGLGGAQQYYGVTPDLAVFGKALASGYPLSVLAGKRVWMQPFVDGSVIHAGTMNSSVSTVVAALATLEVLADSEVYPRLFRLGRTLMDGLQRAGAGAGHRVLALGPGPMFHLGFTDLSHVVEHRHTLQYDKTCYAAFARGMQERGIRLIGRGLWYISAVHTELEIEQAISVASDVFTELRPLHEARGGNAF